MRAGPLTIFIGLAVLTPLSAAPATLHFAARLSGRAEAPPIRADAVGELSADLDTDTRLFTYKLTYQSLSGAAATARFQGPAKSGQIAPPIIEIADTSNPISGEASLTEAQLADLKKGLWYVNIGTPAHPDGEIRGQLKWMVDWGRAEAPAGPPSGYQYLPPPSTVIGNR